MDNKTILEQAIQKAIDGGWIEILKSETWKVTDDLHVEIEMKSPYSGKVIWGKYAWQEFVFKRNFAIALWPEGQYGLSKQNLKWYEVSYDDGRTYVHIVDTSTFHLQQMVIAEDPIKYLGENI